jgi:hypothetical protein
LKYVMTQHCKSNCCKEENFLLSMRLLNHNDALLIDGMYGKKRKRARWTYDGAFPQ